MNPLLRILLITTVCSLGTLTLVALSYSAYLGYSLNVQVNETQLAGRKIIFKNFRGGQTAMAQEVSQVWDDFYKAGFSNFSIYFQSMNFETNGFLRDFSGIIGLDASEQNSTLVSSFLQSYKNYTEKMLPSVSALEVTYPLSTRNFILNYVSGYKLNHKVLDAISRVDPAHKKEDLTMISLGSSKFVDDTNIESIVYVPYGANSTFYETLQ